MISSMILAAALVTGAADGGSGSPDDRAKLAKFLWTGLKDGRDQLRGGAFRAHGVKVIDDPKRGRSTGDVEIFAAFDDAAGLRRFDRHDPNQVTIVRDRAPPKGEADIGPAGDAYYNGGKFVSTPAKVIIWNEGSPAAEMRPPGQASNIDYIRPFDVRCLGLSVWNPEMKDVDLAKAMDLWNAMTLEEVAAEPGGLYRIKASGGDGGLVENTLWVDEAKGFAPIRLEQRIRLPVYGSEPTYLSELTWAKVDGVWVPKTYRNRERIPRSRTTTYELSFDWQSVNGPPSTALFSAEGMELPRNTVVFENRLGKPFVAQIVGRDGYNPNAAAATATAATAPSRRHWPVFIAFNATVSLVILALWTRRRRKSRSIHPVT